MLNHDKHRDPPRLFKIQIADLGFDWIFGIGLCASTVYNLSVIKPQLWQFGQA
jgi:hypothetical protein